MAPNPAAVGATNVIHELEKHGVDHRLLEVLRPRLTELIGEAFWQPGEAEARMERNKP